MSERNVVSRRMGSGALLRDPHDRILVVKPSYKELWEIPGGLIELGESPRSCCHRELGEELGLEILVGRLLVMDWLPPAPPLPDGWQFVYDGGVLDDTDAANIVLPQDELLEWRFVTLEELDNYLPPQLARRMRVAHECALAGTTADLEWGVRPAGQVGTEGRL